MPWAAKRPCAYPGCPELVPKGYCAHHADQASQKRHDAKRPNAHRRGYTRRWAKAARAYLDENPLCVECKKGGQVVAATQVDHIVDHKGDATLFWDQDNWQSLCHSCHSRKTARENRSTG